MNRSSKIAESKRKETEWILYLWPDAPRDEAGSVRAWSERWDGGGQGWMVDFDGRPVYVEHKWMKWPAGPRAVWSILRNAYEQLWDACPARVLLVAAYRPLNSRVEDTLCMLELQGVYVVMRAADFKAAFIEGEHHASE